MNMPKTVLCLCALLFSAGVNADQNDPRLEDLFERLQSANDVTEAAPVEELIWQIWFEHSDAAINNRMQIGVQQMNNNSLSAALATFDQLVVDAPDFAEAWNRRATLHFLLGNYKESEADIVKTLQLEPFHFGALSGRGLVLLSQGQYEAARNAFSRALEVNPNMPEVKNNIDEINRYLQGSTI
jgi:Flp pilus assembly protein TadD